MGELDADERIRIDAADEVDDAPQFLPMRLAPQAKAGRGDASSGADMRRLDHDQAQTGRSETAEMHEMPVLRESVDRAVLAHGRQRDAVTKRAPGES